MTIIENDRHPKNDTRVVDGLTQGDITTLAQVVREVRTMSHHVQPAERADAAGTVTSTGSLATTNTTQTISGAKTFTATQTFGSAWNGAHIVMGTYHFWVDSTGDLRIKNSAPASDLDGTVVGTQA